LKFYNDSVSEKVYLTVNLSIFASAFIHDELKINRRWNTDLSIIHGTLNLWWQFTEKRKCL